MYAEALENYQYLRPRSSIILFVEYVTYGFIFHSKLFLMTNLI